MGQRPMKKSTNIFRPVRAEYNDRIYMMQRNSDNNHVLNQYEKSNLINFDEVLNYLLFLSSLI